MATSRSGASARCPAFRCEPLTAERWADFEALFGERGACGGCWCMWWRLSRSTFNAQRGAGNKRAMKRLVSSGEVPGLVAYRGAEPVGWIAIAPRERFPVLARSRVLAPVDDQPVWSVVCFFVSREHRRQGLTSRILAAASAWAAKQGARIVEGYPVIARRGEMPDAFAYTGLVSSFRSAGFVEVCRRSETRPIMRRTVRR